MIIRRHRNRDFTVIANGVLRDERLSFEAIGVACYLLEKPDHWQVHLRQLEKRGGIGRDKMRRIAKELIEAGYWERVQVRNPETGAFDGVEYVMRDEPGADNDRPATGVASPPQPENPSAVGSPGPDLPAPDLPAPDNPSAVVNTDSGARTDSKQREREGAREDSGEGKPTAAPAPDCRHAKPQQPDVEAGPPDEDAAAAEHQVDLRWNQLKAKYPQALNDALTLSERLFRAAPVDDQVAMVAKVPAYVAHLATQQYRKRQPLQEFIRHRGWEMVPGPASGDAPSDPEAKVILKRFGKDFWILWHRRAAVGVRAVGLWSDWAQRNMPIGVRSADLPSDADRERAWRVEVGGAEWQAWDEYYQVRGIRMPKPLAAEFAWMPAQRPPSAAVKQSEIDEVI